MPARKRARKSPAKQMGTVCTAPYRSPAIDYEEPKIGDIATRVRAVDPAFMPVGNASAILKAYIPKGIAESQSYQMPFRALVQIDCGVEIDLPAGYKLVVNPVPELAAKGVLVQRANRLGSARVTLYVNNMGREIIMLRHGDPVATVEVEPMYLFDWIVDNQ